MNEYILNYYANGNTARGFTSLLESSLQGLELVIVLQGPHGSAKSNFIKNISDQLVSHKVDVWLLHCPRDNTSLDGLIVPSCKMGIVVESIFQEMHSTVADTIIQYVDLGKACDIDQVALHVPVIDELKERISQAYDNAYAGFANALRIHDEWEELYIANMDFDAANVLTTEYTQLLFGDGKLEKTSRVDHRFLGAATPEGAADFVPNLTAGLKRYLLKGRPGSGKSTMLKKWVEIGIERGYDVEIYHCGFDPNSLDMLIVRELGFAIFDSTSPHEYFPDRDTDEIVDIYARCIKPGTDEELADVILRVSQRYSSAMKQSIQYLAEAKSLQDEISNIYTQFMDFSVVDRLTNELQEEIQLKLNRE
ncbi:PRK06851 family protein [Paenibacillus sp. CMAA1364]